MKTTKSLDWWSQGLDTIEKLQWIDKNCRGQDNLERLGSSTFYLRRRHKKKKKKNVCYFKTIRWMPINHDFHWRNHTLLPWYHHHHHHHQSGLPSSTSTEYCTCFIYHEPPFKYLIKCGLSSLSTLTLWSVNRTKRSSMWITRYYQSLTIILTITAIIIINNNNNNNNPYTEVLWVIIVQHQRWGFSGLGPQSVVVCLSEAL